MKNAQDNAEKLILKRRAAQEAYLRKIEARWAAAGGRAKPVKSKIPKLKPVR